MPYLVRKRLQNVIADELYFSMLLFDILIETVNLTSLCKQENHFVTKKNDRAGAMRSLDEY